MNYPDSINPQVRDFILFCADRQDKGWPALYDEMCLVAGGRLFQGLGYSDLRTLGLSFGLSHLGNTHRTVDTIIAGR